MITTLYNKKNMPLRTSDHLYKKVVSFIESDKLVGFGKYHGVARPVSKKSRSVKNTQKCFVDGEIAHDGHIVCDYCSADMGNTEPVYCSGCHVAAYCSKKCAKAHWNASKHAHSEDCQSIADEILEVDENRLYDHMADVTKALEIQGQDTEEIGRRFFRRPWGRRRWAYGRGYYRPYWFWRNPLYLPHYWY